MSEDNKALSRRIFEEIWNNNNLDAANKLIASDIVDHELPPGFPPGLAGFKAFTGMFLSAFPDTKMIIEDQISEGDKVVTRWTASGTHKGELMGIPATGKDIKVMGLDIYRFADGKAVEHWGQFDQMGMMVQLGVVPPPGG